MEPGLSVKKQIEKDGTILLERCAVHVCFSRDAAYVLGWVPGRTGVDPCKNKHIECEDPLFARKARSQGGSPSIEGEKGSLDQV